MDLIEATPVNDEFVPGDDRWVIYAVSDTGEVHILKTGSVNESIQETIIMWEDLGITSEEAPGVYKSTFVWDRCVDWESGIDEGSFVIDDDATLLYLLPESGE